MHTKSFAALLAAGVLTAGVAVAQTQPTQQPPSQGSGQSGMGQSGMGQSGMGQSTQGRTTSQTGTMGDTISAQSMSKQQITDLQQALKDSGQDVSVDGSWGNKTKQALKSFQQSEGIQAEGELNSETIAALGLDPQDFAGTGSSMDPEVGLGGRQGGQSGSGGTTQPPQRPDGGNR